MAGKFSIVIPSHSRIDLLHSCLTTVTQYAPPDTEILVIDDGSPEACISETAQQFPGVTVRRLPQRLGFARAANRGVRAARHAVVELLNDDTEVTADWWQAPLAAFADSTVAAVAPLVLQKRPAPQGDPLVDSAGDRYHLGGYAGKRHHGLALSQVTLKRERVFGASASSAFYRRQAVLAVGGFPESFEAYFEDVDLAFRLIRAGFQALFEPESVIWHQGGASHGVPSGALLIQQSRNEERLYWRNHSWPALVTTLPLHGAVIAGKAYRRWREGQLRPFWQGRMQAWRERLGHQEATTTGLFRSSP